MAFEDLLRLHRHNGCVGLTLFRFGRKQLEIWFAPRGEVISPHYHARIDSTLIILGGKMEGEIANRKGSIGWHDCLRRFHIPSGTIHSAKVTGRFCLFLNYERWTGQPSSAAVDFQAL